MAAIGVLAAILATPLLFPVPLDAASRAKQTDVKTEKTNEKSAAMPADERALTQLGIAIFAIVGTGGLAIWVIRKAKNLPLRRRGRARSLEVVDVLNLGNKKSLAVARVYDRVLILGVAEGNVTLLSEMKEDPNAAATANLDINDTQVNHRDLQPFRSLLQTFTKAARPATNTNTTKTARPAAESRKLAASARPTIAELQAAERVNVTVGGGDDDELL